MTKSLLTNYRVWWWHEGWICPWCQDRMPDIDSHRLRWRGTKYTGLVCPSCNLGLKIKNYRGRTDRHWTLWMYPRDYKAPTRIELLMSS